MYWMDWIGEELAIKRMRRTLPRHIAHSDKVGIKQDFCRTYAQAGMGSEEPESTRYALGDELRRLIAEPNTHVKQNRFHRL